MRLPANFDSVGVDALLSDWAESLRELGADVVLVLGPDPWGGRDDREVLAVHPPRMLGAAQALAQSLDFGASWRDSDAPLVAWQNIDQSAGDIPQARWRLLWLAHGYPSLVRVAFTLPAGRSFECFLFSAKTFSDGAHARELAWSAMNYWPVLRRALAQQRLSLSDREQESLSLAFEGLTARETAARMACSERTVNYHLANAMTKLQTDNKLAAVQRACWIGLL